jgi:hypothetical protein
MNNIYTSSRPLPYVYMCKEKNSPYFYIGYRFANYNPSTQDLGTKYFTSNDYVKENFDNFEHTIIAEFFAKEDAYKFESELIAELDSEYLINTHRYKKTKPYQKVQVKIDLQVCALPGCGKLHRNWRIKCCCQLHNKQYAGQRRHQR